jgi:hypothetical protein
MQIEVGGLTDALDKDNDVNALKPATADVLSELIVDVKPSDEKNDDDDDGDELTQVLLAQESGL